MNNKSGFTLIEVLIAMFVSLVIMGGAYMFFNSQQRQTTIQTNVSDAQQTLRAAMDFMSRDIRMAGYNPTGVTDFTITDIDDDINGMSAIAFNWDNPAGANDSAYSVTAVNGSIVAPNSRALMFNGQPLAGFVVALGLAYAYDDNDLDSQVETDPANGNTVWFYDAGDDDTWDSLVTNQVAGTVNSNNTGIAVDTRTIRAVRIWMLSQSQVPDPNYTDTNTYVVGPHRITPNNNFRHRLIERTVLCRNMGL